MTLRPPAKWLRYPNIMDQSAKSSQVFDVIVLGAGAVGAALAWKLAADGYRVCICEESREPARTFRAEHLSQQTVALCRDLGLFERLKPLLSPLDFTAHFRNGRVHQVTADEDYSVSYERLVNTLRLGLERVATLFQEPVVRVSTQGRVKSVRLQSGRVVCGWMVVATGEGGKAEWMPGLREEMVWREHSVSFAWDMELAEPARMKYPALVFQTTRTGPAYELLRIFRRGEKVRANFFTFWEGSDARRRELAHGDAAGALTGAVEGLADYLQEFRLVSEVEEWPVSLTRVRGGARAGILLVGEAGGALAPVSEIALCRGLHDVKVLAELAPGWLRERQLTPEVLVEFEEHPAKRTFDEEAYSRCIFQRRLATDRGAEWVARRLKGEFVPDWLETAWLRGMRGGRWTLDNVGLPAWRKSVELVQTCRQSRAKAGEAVRPGSGGVLSPGHHDLAGADGFDDLVS